MFRVRKQLGCTDQLVKACGKDGITVALLDTGIGKHPDFDSRILSFKDFVNGHDSQYDAGDIIGLNQGNPDKQRVCTGLVLLFKTQIIAAFGKAKRFPERHTSVIPSINIEVYFIDLQMVKQGVKRFLTISHSTVFTAYEKLT